jgi:murein DD-endopeptidase MepM/ murein hydrolase activator NlpD
MPAPARRLLTLALFTASLVLLPVTAAAAASSCLLPPVPARIVVPFQQPACLWCPGNRGVDYGTPAGTTVRAAGAGTVSFAGPVAGAVWVTVAHAGAMLTSYGPLRALAVRRGAVVVAGDLLGYSAGSLHFGVRVDGRYVDPGPLLGESVHLVPRLVPLGGRIAPPPERRCPAGGARPAVR